MLIAGGERRGGCDSEDEGSYSYTDSIREESLKGDGHDDELCSISTADSISNVKFVDMTSLSIGRVTLITLTPDYSAIIITSLTCQLCATQTALYDHNDLLTSNGPYISCRIISEYEGKYIAGRKAR